MKKVEQSEITKLRSKLKQIDDQLDDLWDARDRGFMVSMDRIQRLIEQRKLLESCI